MIFKEIKQTTCICKYVNIVVILLVSITLIACGKGRKNLKLMNTLTDTLKENFSITVDSLNMVTNSKGQIQADSLAIATDNYVQSDIVERRQVFQTPAIADFYTLSAKISIRYFNKNNAIPPLTGYLRLYKDSVIWLSLYSFGLIEVFRLYLSPQKIQVLDHLHSVAQVRQPNFIQKLLHIPFDFTAIQNFLLGLGGNDEILQQKPTESTNDGFHTYRNYPNYRVENHYSRDSLLLNSKFQNADSVSYNSPKALTETDFNAALIDFSNFATQTEQHFNFPLGRKLKIIGSDTTEIDLKFKDLKWNQPLKFPFTIPARYKIYSDF